MRNVKLKLSYEEIYSLRSLCQRYTGIVEPAVERLRTDGHFGVVATERMLTSILCLRAGIMLAKQLIQPRKPYYRLSVPPEYGCAILLAYWSTYQHTEPDVLLESMFHTIHQQLA